MTSSLSNMLDYVPTADLEAFSIQAYQAGRFIDSLEATCACINRQPENDFHKLRLGVILPAIKIQAYDSRLKESIGLALQSAMVDPQKFAPAWMQLFMLDPSLKDFAKLLDCKDQNAFDSVMSCAVMAQASTSDFVLYGLRRLRFTKPDFEKLITHLRCWTLKQSDNDPSILHDHLSLIDAITMYCQNTDGALYISADEKSILEQCQNEPAKQKNMACILASYEPATLDSQPSKNIQAFGQMENATSQMVRAMYEETPYPRWDMTDITPVLNEDVDSDILIAGCGTGRSMFQFALRFPNAKITAIDLSLASLNYAKAKTDSAGCQNIEFFHGDILELSQLDRRYDYIECAGVLHHMEDPEKGWNALTETLKPHGRMLIALYSALARQSVLKARDFIQSSEYTNTVEDIRRFRRDVMQGSRDHVLYELTHRYDFYNLNECRDLVFHVCEHNYTLPDIESILKRLHLSFLGFRHSNPQAVSLYKQKHKDDILMRNLKNWANLENSYPAMFTGMYQFLCARDDEAEQSNAGFQKIEQTHILNMAGAP